MCSKQASDAFEAFLESCDDDCVITPLGGCEFESILQRLRRELLIDADFAEQARREFYADLQTALWVGAAVRRRLLPPGRRADAPARPAAGDARRAASRRRARRRLREPRDRRPPALAGRRPQRPDRPPFLARQDRHARRFTPRPARPPPGLHGLRLSHPRGRPVSRPRPGADAGHQPHAHRARPGGAAAAAAPATASDSTLLRVLADGQSVSFRIDGELLVIDGLPDGAFTLEIRNTCAPEKNTQLVGPLHLRRRSVHAVRGRGLSPHHLLPRPARRDGGLHRHPARRQGAPTRCCCATATWSSRATSTTAATTRSGTTRSRSRATCSRWSPPTWWRASRRIRSRSGPRPPAAGLGAPRRPRQDRACDGLAGGEHRLGRGALRPAARPRPLHDRRRRRLQHGRDGEQGAEHLQHQVRPGHAGHRHRRRLPRHRERRRP